MAYNGSGVFLINSAGQPVVANTVISATVFNALTSDLATGLSTAITKDGQTTITNNIPFGSNKITGLGSGTAAADAANLGQVQSTVAKLITVTGTDTITGSMSPQLTAYAAGQLFYFVANAANTGAVTLNIDSLGAKSITRDGSSALAAGDINSGEVVVVIYDGTRFQMINAANSFGNTTINGTLTVTGNAGFQANVSITSALSVGGVFAVTGAATFTANPTLSAGTANGVLYLNGSKVATSGSALTFDGTVFATTGAARIANASGNKVLYLGQSSPSASDGASLEFQASNTQTNWAIRTNFNVAGALEFCPSLSAGGTTYTSPLMLLSSSGNLGIGTTSPAGKFQVSATNNQVWAKDSATGDNLVTQVASGAARINAYTSANAALPIIFSHYITDVMTINASGNLGLGVTPSAWTAGGKNIEVGSAGNIIQGQATQIAVIQNATFNSGWKYSANGFASFYNQSSGQHIWYNAPSGTAGNAITFTQAMTLDASGNLGIGTTSPTRKLTISGSGVFAAATGSSIRLDNSSTGRFAIVDLDNSQNLNIWNSDSGAGSIVFWRGSGAGTETARFDSSGNLGIGTTSPAANAPVHINKSTAADCYFRSQNSLSNSIFGTSAAGETFIYNSGAYSLLFFTNGTERARITAAGELLVGLTSATSGGGVLQISNGITFPATQSASSNANTLDDYEEGTYTATLTPGTSGSITVNSSFNTLNYTKIGRVVYVNGYITASSISSPVGSLTLNLPFTTANTTQRSAWGAGVINIAGSASSVANGFGIIFSNNVATATIVIATGANNADAAAQIQGSNNTDIRISFWFITS